MVRKVAVSVRAEDEYRWFCMTDLPSWLCFLHENNCIGIFELDSLRRFISALQGPGETHSKRMDKLFNIQESYVESVIGKVVGVLFAESLRKLKKI